jgi:hypothetical protein
MAGTAAEIEAVALTVICPSVAGFRCTIGGEKLAELGLARLDEGAAHADASRALQLWK